MMRPMKPMPFVLRGWGLLVWGLAVQAAPALHGTVTQVTDGDSLWVSLAEPAAPAPDKPRLLEVRLLGIDAPETCQTGGAEARAALRERLLGQPVSLATAGRDPYGRTLATLTHDGININQWLVAEGRAWSTRTKWDHGPYVKYERMARALRRGVHADGDAETARDFRRRHGPCAGDGRGAAPEPPLRRAATPAAPAFRCDGRTHCSQMRSCDEAEFFLRHCPDTKMDGDRDGVPCETQWCR